MTRVNGCAYDLHDDCDGVQRMLQAAVEPYRYIQVGMCSCECHTMNPGDVELALEIAQEQRDPRQ